MPALKVHNFKLADKGYAWDADMAEARIRKWAGGPDKDSIDWKKYASCFLYVEEGKEENFTGYKLPYCDIINDEPHIVFRAAVAIMAALNGARGGVDISESDRRKVYEEVKKIYKKFDEEAPELKSLSSFRSFEFKEMESSEEDDGFIIEGYAAVFNQLSEDLGGFREMIARGAFKNSLNNDVRALLNHDPNFVLGRTKAGTLVLDEDDKGLRVLIKAPKVSWVEDLIVSMRRGDIDQMSFGFFVKDDEWRNKDGQKIRILKEVDLFDVSIVTFPAYTQTSAQVRAQIEELERIIKRLEEQVFAQGRRDEELKKLKLFKYKLKLLEKYSV